MVCIQVSCDELDGASFRSTNSNILVAFMTIVPDCNLELNDLITENNRILIQERKVTETQFCFPMGRIKLESEMQIKVMKKYSVVIDHGR